MGGVSRAAGWAVRGRVLVWVRCPPPLYKAYAWLARRLPGAGMSGGLSRVQGSTPRTWARRSMLDSETFHLQRSMAET